LDKHRTLINEPPNRGEDSVASILVIDDDHAVLATIRLLLERHSHDVVVTDDGRKGLDLFRTGTFDLLIVDIFMPAMDGLETMNLVHRYRPEVPVIVISGHEVRSASKYAPNFLRMATKLGAVSSIQKPFRPGDFLSAVDGCLSDSGRLPPPLARARKNLSTE
jgi:CheY-like chemotaxis protein